EEVGFVSPRNIRRRGAGVRAPDTWGRVRRARGGSGRRSAGCVWSGGKEARRGGACGFSPGPTDWGRTAWIRRRFWNGRRRFWKGGDRRCVEVEREARPGGLGLGGR